MKDVEEELVASLKRSLCFFFVCFLMFFFLCVLFFAFQRVSLIFGKGVLAGFVFLSYRQSIDSCAKNDLLACFFVESDLYVVFFSPFFASWAPVSLMEFPKISTLFILHKARIESRLRSRLASAVTTLVGQKFSQNWWLSSSD